MVVPAEKEKEADFGSIASSVLLLKKNELFQINRLSWKRRVRWQIERIKCDGDACQWYRKLFGKFNEFEDAGYSGSDAQDGPGWFESFRSLELLKPQFLAFLGESKTFTVHKKNPKQNLLGQKVRSFDSSPGLEFLSRNTSLRSSSLELQHDGTSSIAKRLIQALQGLKRAIMNSWTNVQILRIEMILLLL